jgi:hypothetical protein
MEATGGSKPIRGIRVFSVHNVGNVFYAKREVFGARDWEQNAV